MRHALFRIAALLLFLLSFNLNSLLVLHYGVVALVAGHRDVIEGEARPHPDDPARADLCREGDRSRGLDGPLEVPYRRTFARLLSFLRPYRRGVVISIVLAVGSQAAQIALIWVTGRGIIDRALLRIQANPQEEGLELLGALSGRWRKRVSGYRIIYRIRDDGRLVIVDAIRPRGPATYGRRR